MLIRLAEALEDVMTAAAEERTVEGAKLWAACRPAWLLVQRLLREARRDG